MKTTDVGYINQNNQKNLGYRGISETHYNQKFFEMECLDCGHKYMANGCDVWLRKCPQCEFTKKKRPKNPSKNEIDYVREALTQFNNERVGNDGHTPINLVEYDGDGNVIGGIIGGTYWGWMYVEILWVHEDHRKKGIGSKLLLAAEKEAIRRDCHHVHLDTMSWQAPEFYKKHGYEVIATLPDIPKGNQKYLLQKSL